MLLLWLSVERRQVRLLDDLRYSQIFQKPL
jgi:hypothetical protein